MPSEREFYRAEIVRLNARVIHAHCGTDARYFLGAVRRTGRPLVVSYYGYDVSTFVHDRLGAGKRLLAPLWEHSAAHLAMSPAMAETLVSLGAPSERVRVHHHGIDTRFWAMESAEATVEPYLLQVASLQRVKGHDDFLRAFGRLQAHFPDLHLHLVGRGPEAARLAGLASSLGIADRVRFIGHLPHGDALRSEYAGALAFCHPSRETKEGAREGVQGTILEAMACARAVVATNHGGIPYAVRHGVNGFIVPEGDVPALAEALEAIVEDDALRHRFGRAGQAIVRNEFDVVAQGARLEGIYDEAAGFN